MIESSEPTLQTIDAEAFRSYVAGFNRSDFDAFGRYYAPEIIFDGRAATLRGRDELLRFYRHVKSRIRETIEIRDLVIGENAIAADLITELYPLEDWLDFPTGALHKGEARRSQNFIWYDIEGGRFTRIRAAGYRRGATLPPEEGESVAGGSQPTIPTASMAARSATPVAAMSRDEFGAYIEAFNRDDYDRFMSFYDPQVRLVISGQNVLRGPDEIRNFYRGVKAQTRRTIEIRNFISTPGRIAAELESEFLALEDVPQFPAGPLKSGERLALHTVVLYELHEGRFKRIRSATLRKQMR